MKKGFTLLLLIGTCFQLLAQYTPKRDKFGKEFQANLIAFTDPSEQEFIKKEILPFFLSPTNIPDEVFNKMVDGCNLLVSKRADTYPHIYNYVVSTYYMMKNPSVRSNFDLWNKTVEAFANMKSNRKVKDFLEFSGPFWSQTILSGRNNFNWFYRKGSILMKEDKKGPYFELNGGDIVCELDNRSKGENRKVIDSVVIAKSDGVYYPMDQEYFGKGGKITWEKVGLKSTETYADLVSDYKISTSRADLKVDTVRLKSPEFKEQVSGVLLDRAYNINRESDKTYPRFQSFDKSLLIKNFIPDVDYKGGFKYEGANFVGTSVAGVPATLLIYNNKHQLFGKVYADVVTNTALKLYADNASITIFLGEKDSITQPDLTFNFFKSRNTFEFTRSKEGGGISPFLDTYHQLDMYVPKLTWVKDSSALVLTYGIEVSEVERIATLESLDYYSDQSFNALQGITSQNPLVLLYNYCYKYDEYELTMGKFATALQRTPEQSQQIYNILKNQGFISYDANKKLVKINEKTMRYMDATRGKIDYDNIVFTSDLRIGSMPPQYSDEDIRNNPKLQKMKEAVDLRNDKRRKLNSFGTIDLKTLELKLNAIEKVNVSEKNFTFVAPNDDQLTILKNRDFKFSGWIRSGKVEVNVLKGDYSYDQNLFHLLKTDETILSVQPLKKEDGESYIFMNSFISHAEGALYVDAPDNRSGNNKEITDYPKLDIRNKAKIFYQNKFIQQNAYDSTRFYFVMDPVMIDSLVYFNDKQLSFDGELVSAGIFPTFREKIKVMPDYSFGFSRMVPKEGFPFYETTAKYANKIVLSNNGLQGSGSINFIHSLSESNEFTFLPDSTIGFAKFTNQPFEKGVTFPDAKGEKVQISYNPRKAYLNVYTTEKPVIIFDSVKYSGQLVIKGDGMTGRGLITLPDASLASKGFKFTRWKALADTSNFDIRNKNVNKDEGRISFKTENVNSDLDFKERKGIFNSNRGTTKTYFPLNDFYCLMDRFVWYMDEQSIDLETNKKADVDLTASVDLATSNFFSTNPKQDSLSFRVPKARFSINEKIIYCQDMDFVDIADARIFPYKGKLDILKKGKIREMDSSKIIANYITKYYTFDRAKVTILARRNFEASGRYMYKDVTNKPRPVAMNRIYVDTAFRTIALGTIAQEESFQLSPYFDYYGKVRIETSDPFIEFEGATRIIHQCEQFPKSWMAFQSRIDPKNIQIPVSSAMKTLEGTPIMAGLVWHDSKSPDSIQIYPTFLSELQSIDDKEGIIMMADGFLQYNVGSNEYEISNTTKLQNRNEAGNYLSLHTKTCSLRGDGKINFGTDYGRAVVDAYGTINYDNATKEVNMNITANFQYPILDETAFEKWATKVVKNESLKDLDWNNSTLGQALLEVKDVKTSDEIKNEFIQNKSVRKVPKEFEKGIVVTGIQLKSYKNANENGFITSLGNASLVNVFKKPVFKQIPFSAFFSKVYSQQTTGDSYQFRMDIPGMEECFFDYQTVRKGNKIQKSELQIYSLDDELKQAMMSKKENNMKDGNFNYKYTENSGIESNFLRKF